MILSFNYSIVNNTLFFTFLNFIFFILFYFSFSMLFDNNYVCLRILSNRVIRYYRAAARVNIVFCSIVIISVMSNQGPQQALSSGTGCPPHVALDPSQLVAHTGCHTWFPLGRKNLKKVGHLYFPKNFFLNYQS